jgi:hypothetical protein
VGAEDVFSAVLLRAGSGIVRRARHRGERAEFR